MTGNDNFRIVISKYGHDKGKVYVILKSETEYVYLVDGFNRTLNNPKKKNKKHIQYTNYVDESLYQKFITQDRIIEEDIKRAIKLYKQNHND